MPGGCAGPWGPTDPGSDPWSAPGLRVGGGLAQGTHEPVPVVLELPDLDLDAGRDVVDRDEERQLTFPQRIDDLAVSPGDLEDAHPVGDQLDLGQLLVELRATVQIVPRATYALERHPVVQQRLDDPQRDEVTERVQARHTRAPSGGLDGGGHPADLVPVAELARGAPGELRGLMCGESLHRNVRPPRRSPSRHQHGSARMSKGRLDVRSTV